MKENYLFEHIKRKLAEAKADTADCKIEEELYKQVWLPGYPALTEVFRPIDVEKGSTSVVIAIAGTLTPGTMTAGDFGVTNMPYTYSTIDINKNKGLSVGWTREWLEDSVQGLGPQLAEVGRSIEEQIFKDCLTELETDVGANTILLSSTFSYANFLAGIAALEANNYHCDVVLCNPQEYYELLNDDKFIHASYVGNTSPVNSGVIQTTLGARVFCSTDVATGKVFFLDSRKALALGWIRQRTTESYALPTTNQYGVVASVRYGLEVVIPLAVVMGAT